MNPKLFTEKYIVENTKLNNQYENLKSLPFSTKKDKSIELGFNGELNKQLYIKWLQTIHIRIKLLQELSITITLYFAFLYATLYLSKDVLTLFLAMIFNFIMLFWSIKIVWIFVDIARIKKRRKFIYAQEQEKKLHL